MNKTTYKEITDSMASLMTLNADAYHLYKTKKISEEILQNVINTTNIAIFKCEQEFARNKN